MFSCDDIKKLLRERKTITAKKVKRNSKKN